MTIFWMAKIQILGIRQLQLLFVWIMSKTNDLFPWILSNFGELFLWIIYYFVFLQPNYKASLLCIIRDL